MMVNIIGKHAGGVTNLMRLPAHWEKKSVFEAGQLQKEDVVALRAKPQKPLLQGQKTKQL